MKLTTLLLVFSIMQVSATSFAQKVTLNKKKAPLIQVMDEIRAQTGYDFFYDLKLIKSAKPVTINIKDATLSEALEKCFAQQPFVYEVDDKAVVLKEKVPSILDKAIDRFKAIDIRGKVLDENGNPLAGATILVKGRGDRTTTNENGEFSLSKLEDGAILQISFIGYLTKEIEANSDLSGIRLIINNSKLDEVQVIGYGTTTQRFNVGSVTKISADDISKQAISNPLAALQGRVPGLVVTSTSGIPGASFNIQIRGQNTLKSDQSLVTPRDNPLFIIDGVPYAPQNGNINQFTSIASPGIAGVYNNSSGGLSPFNSINPSDIESIEILRDADATAIYGSRGGNGVILITTKRGKAGKTTFALTANTGISMVGKTMPMMNTEQYLAMRSEALKNGGLTPNLTLNSNGYAPDILVFDQNKYTNWKEVFLGNTAYNNNINASLSGGNANTQFHIGAGFNRDTYVFPGDFGDNRASLSFNIHHVSENQKLKVDFSSNSSYNKNNSSGSPNLLAAYTLEPNYPDLIDQNGNLVWNYKGVVQGSSGVALNPFSYLKMKYDIQNKTINSNLLASYTIVDNLTLRSSFGYNVFYSDEYSGNPKSAQNPSRNPIATARFGKNNFETWIIEPQLEFKKSIGKNTFSILLGTTFQKSNNAKMEASGSGYISDELMGSVSGAPTRTVSDNFGAYNYSAVFGRINYRLDNKYIFNINARRDGSSRFGPDKQFGNFGSIGAGWLFNEEHFIKENLNLLSYGKIRGSYGITGSDAIADYQYIPRWSPSTYTYQGSIGYLPQNLYNSQFSWASTKKLEFGLELGFFKDRLLFSSTFYQNRTGDQLIMYNLPATTGFSTVVENWDAIVQNSGAELTLQSTLLKGKDFSWQTTVNMTIPKNKLLAFPNLGSSSYSTTYTLGKSLNSVNGFRYNGVNEDTGIFQFINAEGQITYTPKLPSLGKFNDYYNIGNLDPKFYGGIQNSLTYKDVTLDFFVEFKKQLGINYLSQVYAFLPGMERNVPAELIERWSKAGDRTNIQKFSAQLLSEYTGRTNFLRSDGVYSDASYIKLRTVSLSYNIPNKFIRKAGMQNMRVYSNAQNLFTISSYKGNDPETQNFYGLPPLRTVVFGLNVTF